MADHTPSTGLSARVARAITGRPRILVFNGSYHGWVDETFVRLIDWRAVHSPGLLGQFVDLTQGTTLSASALALAAMRATLEQVMTEEAYRHMNARAAELEAGLAAALERALHLPLLNRGSLIVAGGEFGEDAG